MMSKYRDVLSGKVIDLNKITEEKMLSCFADGMILDFSENKQLYRYIFIKFENLLSRFYGEREIDTRKEEAAFFEIILVLSQIYNWKYADVSFALDGIRTLLEYIERNKKA